MIHERYSEQSKFSVGTGPAATKATATAREEEEEEVMKRLHYECVAKFLIALRLTAIEALDRQTDRNSNEPSDGEAGTVRQTVRTQIRTQTKFIRSDKRQSFRSSTALSMSVVYWHPPH